MSRYVEKHEDTRVKILIISIFIISLILGGFVGYYELKAISNSFIFFQNSYFLWTILFLLITFISTILIFIFLLGVILTIAKIFLL